MKKVIILILTLSLILGIFISCGNGMADDMPDITATETSDSETSSGTKAETTADTKAETTTHISEENSTETNEETTIEPDKEDNGYTIEKIGDQYYIVCDSYTVDNNYEKSKDGFLDPSTYEGTDQPVSLFCDSVANIKNKFYSLTDSELNSIKRSWERDENGIPIIDLDNLYYPILPAEVEYYGSSTDVVINQYSYGFKIVYDHTGQGSGIPDGRLIIITKEDYDKGIEGSNSDITVLTQGDKEIRFGMIYDKTYGIYSYSGGMKCREVYVQFWLDVSNELDDGFFMEFDFATYTQ